MLENTLKHQIRISITINNKNNFQDFINALFLKKYGTNFLPTRQYKDKGCDGILGNNKVVAIYSPEREALDIFKSKIKSDYEKYTKYWQKQYPYFLYVYNGEYTAEMLIYCDGVSKDVIKWDISHLIEIISDLPYRQLREIVDYLKIDDQYFIFDVLKNVIEDMIKNNLSNNKQKFSNIPPNIIDKIKINYSQKDIDLASKEYENVAEYLAELGKVLKGYDDNEIAALKNKVLTTFNQLAGDFKTRLKNTEDILVGSQNKDDIYRYFVKVVLIYFFESCLIGKKVD